MMQHSTLNGDLSICSGSPFPKAGFHSYWNKILATTLFLAFWMMSGQVQAQLTGIKTIPGDYPTIAAAVNDPVTGLNVQGVGAGGVTFNVAAGHTETLTARLDITATGTMADPIVFQKNGAGANPLITAYTGTVASPGTTSPGYDALVVIVGSDYLTIDGIDLQEAAGNTDNTTRMEYGYIMVRGSDVNGCHNNTIKNCTVTLDRENTATCGISITNYGQFTNDPVIPTAASGSNSFNKLYSNTVQNTNVGIFFRSYAAPSPFTLGDTDNDVGGSSAATGNIIKNFGGATTATASNGIFVNNQWGVNVSYNTINNNDGGGVNNTSTLRGIFLNSSSTSASANCNNNNVTIHAGGTTSQVTGIENAFGGTPAGNTININNNTVTGDYLTATTGVFYGIWNNNTAQATLNIMNN